MYGYNDLYNPLVNPYLPNTGQSPYQQAPKQEVVKVNGENGARAFPIGANSSALLLDESGAIVWLVVSDGAGYYDIDMAVTVEPTAIGAVTVAAYKNGVQIPGAIAYGYVGTVDEPVTLPIIATIRQNCCDSADNITAVLIENAGVVTNISTRIKKD